MPGLPTHGCNNLACAKCKRAVRTAVCAKGTIHAGAEPRRIYEEILTWPVTPQPIFRVYVCECHIHVEVREDSIHHDYAYDEDLIPWKCDWSCAGHPLVELPRTFDGVLVTAEGLESVAARDAARRHVAPLFVGVPNPRSIARGRAGRSSSPSPTATNPGSPTTRSSSPALIPKPHGRISSTCCARPGSTRLTRRSKAPVSLSRPHAATRRRRQLL